MQLSIRNRISILLLIVSGVWFWMRYHEHSSLAAQVASLQKRLAQSHTPLGTNSSDRKRIPTALDRRPVDWAAVAQELRNGKSIGGGLLRSDAQLRALIEAMSIEELWAAFGEISAADLSKTDREVLEDVFARSLLQKDPERTFTTFTTGERKERAWLLGEEFERWLARDEAVALHWLQNHASAGGYLPGQMISTPFFNRIATAPSVAIEILKCVPPESRLESLRSLDVRVLRSSGQEQWAEIARSMLPPEDHLKAISWPTSNWSDGDGSPMSLQEVDAYFTRISATPAEKEACVMTVASEPRSWGGEGDDPSFALFQVWVAGQAPDQQEAATLVAIGRLAAFSHFSQASDIALAQHQQTGNDAYLTSVLEHVDDLSEPETIRKLIGELGDPELQAKYRKELSRKLE